MRIQQEQEMEPKIQALRKGNDELRVIVNYLLQFTFFPRSTENIKKSY